MPYMDAMAGVMEFKGWSDTGNGSGLDNWIDVLLGHMYGKEVSEYPDHMRLLGRKC